jgi:hypothetical protein
MLKFNASSALKNPECSLVICGASRCMKTTMPRRNNSNRRKRLVSMRDRKCAIRASELHATKVTAPSVSGRRREEPGTRVRCKP